MNKQCLAHHKVFPVQGLHYSMERTITSGKEK